MHAPLTDIVQANVKDIEAVVVQLPVQSLAALPPTRDVRQLRRQILFLANDCLEKQRTPLAMSQKIVQLLYKTTSQLGREVYVALLDQLCHSFEDVAKEAITWLIYAEDEVSGHLARCIFANILSPAQVQHPCHCDASAKRPCKHHPGRPATRQIPLRGPSTISPHLCSRSHPGMPVQ